MKSSAKLAILTTAVLLLGNTFLAKEVSKVSKQSQTIGVPTSEWDHSTRTSLNAVLNALRMPEPDSTEKPLFTSVALDESQWKALSVGDVVARGIQSGGQCTFGTIRVRYARSLEKQRGLGLAFDNSACRIVVSQIREIPKPRGLVYAFRPLADTGHAMWRPLLSYNQSGKLFHRVDYNWGSSGFQAVYVFVGPTGVASIEAIYNYFYDPYFGDAYGESVTGGCDAPGGFLSVDSCNVDVSGAWGGMMGRYSGFNGGVLGAALIFAAYPGGEFACGYQVGTNFPGTWAYSSCY